MGCPAADHDGDPATPDVPVCTGYELKVDLDFDSDGDGDVDAADQYWNGGVGWEPIGTLGIWSDGETMWVTDLSDKKIYSYNMPSKAPATQAHATDFNGDGKTDFADFFLFIDAYGGTDARFDLDGNGTVDFADFFQFIDAFSPSGQAKLVAMARELIGLPGETELRQNWPNPFNSETVLSWFLLQPGPVRLEVFSLTGQRLAVLHQGPLQAGRHRLHWDGRDDEGRPLASGVYLFRLVTTESVLTRKLTLLR